MKQPNKPALVPGECQLFKQCVNLATNPLNKRKVGGAFSTECAKIIICDCVNGTIHSLIENFEIWTRHRWKNSHCKSNTGYKSESWHYMGVHSDSDLQWQSNRESFILNCSYQLEGGLRLCGIPVQKKRKTIPQSSNCKIPIFCKSCSLKTCYHHWKTC